MYNDYIYDYDLAGNYGSSSSLWSLIALIIAIAATVCIFVVFLNKKNEDKFKGFLGWLYDFLSFKKLAIDIILKVTYVCLAIYITLSSFALISTSFGLFLMMLIGGNVSLRIIYELLMITISICNNVSEINKKMKK
ncbi:MAG: hypothetical protein IJB71_01910 [Bacilli bacterium]|nr:hypothetical protein [Bacilli bacterium]